MFAAFALLALTAGQDGPAIVSRDPDGARQLVCEALALCGAGILRQQQDRFVEAAGCLEDAVRLDPDAIAPRQLLIPLYDGLGRPNDAAATAAAVVAMDPSRSDTWRTLARLLHEMKRTDEAIGVLSRCVAASALANQPAERIAALADLARLHAILGEHAATADVCRKALDLHSKHRTLLLKNSDSADLDRQQATMYDLLGAASLATNQFAVARDAALQARASFRNANETARAADMSLNLAAAYAGLKDNVTAHALLDDYLAARPRDVNAFALRARLLRDAGAGRTAVAVLRRAADADPDFSALWVLLGDQCRAIGELHEADQAYRAALSRKPDVSAYRGLFALFAGPGGRPEIIIDLIDEKVREALPDRNNKAPEDDATREGREAAAEYVRALGTALRLEPTAAEQVLAKATEEVLQRAERTYETWGVLTGVAEQIGKPALAERLYRVALKGGGPNPEYRFRIAFGLLHVLLAERKHGDAADLCRRIVESRFMADYKPYFQGPLAWSLAKLGRIDEALKESKTAVDEAHGPQMLTERIRRVDILAYVGQLETAEAECRKMLQENTQLGEVQRIRHALAFTYSTALQFDKAEEQYRLILELDPADAEAHNSLGYELADRGRNLDEAERLIRRALELDRAKKSDSLEDDGENASHVDSLGWVLFRRGRFAEAKALIEQAAANPTAAANPEIWDHLGDICARMGKPAEAAAAWERARDLARTERRTLNDLRGAEIDRKLKRLHRD